MTSLILLVCYNFKQYLPALRSLSGRSSKLRLVNIVLDAATKRTHELKRLHLNTVFWFKYKPKDFLYSVCGWHCNAFLGIFTAVYVCFCNLVFFW